MLLEAAAAASAFAVELGDAMEAAALLAEAHLVPVDDDGAALDARLAEAITTVISPHAA